MKFMPAGPLCTIFAGKLLLLLNMADREDLARLLSSAVSRAISETLSAQDSSQQSESSRSQNVYRTASIPPTAPSQHNARDEEALCSKNVHLLCVGRGGSSVCVFQDSLYIMAKMEPLRSLKNNDAVEISDEEDFDDNTLMQSVFADRQENIQQHEATTSSSLATHRQAEYNHDQTSDVQTTDLFRSYVSLVDEEIELLSDDGGGGSDVSNVNDVETTSTNNNLVTLPEILQELQGKLNRGESSHINVRRSAIWIDTCRQLMRKKFSPLNNISVKFADKVGTSEGAVDVGGPKREFLRLAVRAANLDSGIFIGPEGCRSLYPNSIAREKSSYRMVGLILAWSVVHGGPGGNFLSPTLYNSIVYGPGMTNPRLEDVPNPELKGKIEKIGKSQTVDELAENVKDEEIQTILNDLGANTVHLGIDKKNWYKKIILRHVLIDSVRYLLEEFKNGLETIGVLDAMQKYPEKFRDLFTNENVRPLDAQCVDLLFTIQFDEQGSNARQKQELAVVFWRDYLQDCESKEAQATLEAVMVFATGADVPPILGFDTIPTISFTDGVFPTSNTCSAIIRLPTIHNTYDDFKEKMDFAILNSPSFGQA
ncbi:G2/M phase-specific E3 ubiquitin-protein ligase-like isoform X2 [Montipora capricornis]|uniref:G2/M phase-specific E3 ubiquitin-protein ligase-like isoform X2 n=1 Tax=Montipora capricornis TaxID=246305 RepID=UPI0035F11A55